MKKLLFVIAPAMLCFFISCKDSGTDNTATNSAKNTERNKEVYRAIETGDVSKLDSFIDKDIVDHSGENGEIRGLDSLKKMFIQMHNQFSGLKIELVADATTSNGEYHFAWYKMSGTCTVASMGMPAGTHMNMSGVDVVRIKDDKAVEHWGFNDPKEMMEMMKMHQPGDMNKMDKMEPADSTKK